jgi:hypothetical protein
MKKLLMCLVVVGVCFVVDSPKQAAANDPCAACGGCCVCEHRTSGSFCTWLCC